MTTKIPRPCRHGGCMTLTTEGYCDKHKADLNPKRDSSSVRLYGHKWRKESKLFLASHPYCAECERQGRHTLATEVDHIKPHKGKDKGIPENYHRQGNSYDIQGFIR